MVALHTQDLGTFTYGDRTDQEIPLVNEDGDAFDLTGASAITLECTSAGRDVLSLACTASDPHGGIVTVTNLGTAFEPTATRRRVAFLGRLRWTYESQTYYSRDQVRFVIELFP